MGNLPFGFTLLDQVLSGMRLGWDGFLDVLTVLKEIIRAYTTGEIDLSKIGLAVGPRSLRVEKPEIPEELIGLEPGEPVGPPGGPKISK